MTPAQPIGRGYPLIICTTYNRTQKHNCVSNCLVFWPKHINQNSVFQTSTWLMDEIPCLWFIQIILFQTKRLQKHSSEFSGRKYIYAWNCFVFCVDEMIFWLVDVWSVVMSEDGQYQSVGQIGHKSSHFQSVEHSQLMEATNNYINLKTIIILILISVAIAFKYFWNSFIFLFLVNYKWQRHYKIFLWMLFSEIFYFQLTEVWFPKLHLEI